MNRIIIFFISLLLFTACDKNEDPSPAPEPTQAERTVLIYMSGENNLTQDYQYPGESFLADDLEEIIEGSYKVNSKQHLICFVDSVGTNNKPYIIEVSNGKTKEVYRYESDFYASDPAKFREVLQYTIDNYPAKEYGLVLWGHASGWIVHNDTVPSVLKTREATRGYGKDEGWDTNGSSKWMNITQMAQALETIPKLKFILADCCNFMCVEVGYELRNCAEYLIGSPAEIPGEGAPYHLMIEKLFSTSPTFYKDICNCYYNYFLDAYTQPDYSDWNLEGYSVPLSVFRLDQMENLADATKQLMQKFMPKYPEQLDLTNLPYYLYNDRRVIYDVKTVFKKYAPESDYNKWLDVFNTAVPYQAVSQRWMSIFDTIRNDFYTFPQDTESWGTVSMFFPQTYYNSCYFDYNKRIRKLQWYNAVDWASYGW
jgi:hypothetical protein